MQRRSLLKAIALAAPAAALHDLFAEPTASPAASALHMVGDGQDLSGRNHSLGFGTLSFKVSTAETAGGLFVIEHTHLRPGGPPMHLHSYQDEWFYVMEGEVAFQVGDQRLHLKPGESVLGPRRIPHTFSSVAESSRLLIAFTPAGKMEQYFRDAEDHEGLRGQPEFMNRYDMQWVGPSPFHKS
jgi:mannose-6-phosphate isomerase-like protein (cupin superfamily)